MAPKVAVAGRSAVGKLWAWTLALAQAMERTSPPGGIAMCQGGDVVNATTKEEASMEQVIII